MEMTIAFLKVLWVPQTGDIDFKGPRALEMNFIFQNPRRSIALIFEKFQKLRNCHTEAVIFAFWKGRAGGYHKRMTSNLECPVTKKGISISQVQEKAQLILGKFLKIEKRSWQLEFFIYLCPINITTRKYGIEFGVSCILDEISIFQDRGERSENFK